MNNATTTDGRMTTTTFGAAHNETASLHHNTAALAAWAADRRAAWAFMRSQDDLGNSAGYPVQVGGVWTVKAIDWSLA